MKTKFAWPGGNPDMLFVPFENNRIMFKNQEGFVYAKHNDSDEFGTKKEQNAWGIYVSQNPPVKQKSRALSQMISQFQQDHLQMLSLGFQGGPLCYKRPLAETNDGRWCVFGVRKAETEVDEGITTKENSYCFFVGLEALGFKGHLTESENHYSQFGLFANAAVLYERFLSGHFYFGLPALNVMLGRNKALTNRIAEIG